MGLGYALTEELRFRGGEISRSEFRYLFAAAILVAAKDRVHPGRKHQERPRRAARSHLLSPWEPYSPMLFSMRHGARVLQLPMTPRARQRGSGADLTGRPLLRIVTSSRAAGNGQSSQPRSEPPSCGGP